MDVEIVAASLYDHLLPLLEQSDKADLAIAFVKKSGTDLLAREFARLHEHKQRIRVIFSTAFGLTEPEALSHLASFGAFLHVLRPANDDAGIFHAKLWIIHLTDGKMAIIIGSSNMTGPALVSNTELNVSMIGHAEEPQISKCLSLFENLWSPASGPVTSDFIADYARTIPLVSQRNMESRREIDEVVRQCVITNESATRQLSKVILEKLQAGPTTTQHLYEAARERVPHLCDDSIPCRHGNSGQSEWQHWLRGAVDSLRKKGKIKTAGYATWELYH